MMQILSKVAVAGLVAASSSCDDGSMACNAAAMPKRGSAMLQADGNVVQQAMGTMLEDHTKLQSASLLETSEDAKKASQELKQETKEKSDAQLASAPLTSKVTTLETEVAKLQKNVATLESSIGIGPSAGAAGAATAAPAGEAAGAPAEEEAAAAEEAEAALTEIGQASQHSKAKAHKKVIASAAIQDANEDPTMDEMNEEAAPLTEPGQSLQQLKTKTHRRTAAAQQQPQQLKAHRKAHVKAHDLNLLQKEGEEGWHQAASHGVAAPVGSLKAKVSTMEATLADLASRTAALENEVLGRSAAALIAMKAETKPSLVSTARKLEPAGALKSRIMRMEDKVDNLTTRANALLHEVLG